MPLRYYQEDACGCVRCALEEFDRVLLSLGTGAGKTVCAASLIQSFLPGRTVFLADQDELCSQPLNVIARHANIIPALEKGKHRASLNAKVVVASSQTLAREERLYRFPRHFFDYGIVDECHRGADRDRKITEHLCRKVVGITATPFLSDLRDLSEYYEETAYRLPMMNLDDPLEGLIGKGFAPPLKVLRIPLEIDLAGVKSKKAFGETEYDLESVSTTIEPYFEKGAELLKEHAAQRHTIVFLPLIRSSEAFAAIARQAGISALHVGGKDHDRDEKILAFAEGRVQMICNSDLLSTGVDIPIADCLANLSPCRSVVRYQQRVGRILRVLAGVIDDIPGPHQIEERKAAIAASAKPDALLIDFLWQHDKLGVIGPESLIARNQAEALGLAEKVKAQRTPEQLEEIAKWFQQEREAQLVKQLEKVAGRAGCMEPAKFGYLINSSSLMAFEPETKWQAEPPSPKQLDLLRDNGIDADKISCKGEASKMIDAIQFRKRFRLASVGKLQALKDAGIPFDARTLTDRQALQMITEHKLRYANAA